MYNATVAKALQSCPTLCDPTDCSLPGFSVHGILQARTLEWVAISFSMYNSQDPKKKLIVEAQVKGYTMGYTYIMEYISTIKK